MKTQEILEIIITMQAEHSVDAAELTMRIGKAVVAGHSGEATTEDILEVTRKQAKADVLEELLGKIDDE